jgi:hypothetical protein
MNGLFLKKESILLMSVILTACGGSGSDSSSSSSCSLESSTVNITGDINYERVPFSATNNAGLDYNNIETLPVRGAVIQALVNGCVLTTGETSSTGSYSLKVNPDTNIQIRVQAKIQSTDDAIWDFEVRDNTNNNGLYTLDGSSIDSGDTDSVRNLTASTGWGGSSYTSDRASAPFAILDSVYDSVMKVVAVDADVNMDDADVFWSENNSTASNDDNDYSAGEIGTSHYSNDEIYILGKENSDTDEFDDHVIIHEWGHYFEDNLSRSDSIGGSHSTGDLLDMRVALGEGFGNALSGMVTDDPVYRDSSGAAQGTDFSVDVDENSNTNPGWFSEGSVQSILYDLYDTDADTNDAVALGFTGIYDAMTSSDYINQSTFTSLFSLIDEINALNPGETANIDTLVIAQTDDANLGVDSVADKYASGETHGAYATLSADILPIYTSIEDDGVAVTVCSHNDYKEDNGVEVRSFLNLNVSSAGTHTLLIDYESGDLAEADSDPDVYAYLNGSNVFTGEGDVAGKESGTVTLNADEYILEVYEFNNIDDDAGTGDSVCFDVSVTAS